MIPTKNRDPWKVAATLLALAVLAFLLTAFWVDGVFTPAALSAGVCAIALVIVGGIAADPNRKD